MQSWLAYDFFVKIKPLRIGRLDQFQLPRPLPFLDRLLAGNGRFHRFVQLEPDKGVHLVFLRKALDLVVLVLPDTLGEVGGDAYVERAIALAGKDVDAGEFHAERISEERTGYRRSPV